MERGKAKERDKFVSSSSREPVKAEKEKRKDVEVKSKGKSVELKVKKGKETGKEEEKRKDVGQKNDSGKSKEEDKRKSVDAKIKEDGKEKGKEEEKRKSVDAKIKENGKEKGKEEEKRKSVELKIKENGKEEEKRKSVELKIKENGKEEEKRKSVELKIKENGKEKGKEEEKRKSVDAKIKENGKEKGKEEEKRKSVELKIKEKGKEEEKRKSVDAKIKEKGKEEEKRKSMDAKIKENGKDKGKEEEKRKSVDAKIKENGKEKGKEEKRKSVELKIKENGKGKEVKEEQGMENEEEQVTEKVKDSSSTSFKIQCPPLPPVRDLGPASPPRRLWAFRPAGSVTSPPKYAENRILSEGVCLWMAGVWGNKSNQILVVGLDGAGKTSILHSLASNRIQHSPAPTQGFNEVCISTEDRQMEFLEIGGSEPFRTYWDMYVPKVWLLIFVVDSADHSRLPEARRYLHQLIAPNPGLPLVVFANKQDLEDAYHILDIHDALALSEVGNDRKLFLIGTQVTDNGSEIPSTMQDARDLIAHLAANM
ncbi:LOW QUALITY PROTEIN: ADP-ribosylation factor-like protein 9 [Microtus pennsylvanicus]|uniref:LOW QUALITY PROTEIN: ADP-ribosylation factor-like protein 9 n=1 Tax=Microtus pennsylvanicus TaxID=10058 RepID=UPI003F6AA313